jgi:hypothetical protein
MIILGYQFGVFKQSGTQPKFEACEIGHFPSTRHFSSKGRIEGPLWVQGVTSTLDHMS